ncbi:hypothetical protein [Vulcanisaeta distributa]|uniref:hypothetical protein n=1 Tax=Vulcanisaeta distributa TaxID=164451 RepID=UPI0006D0A40E|nr:hypothetical protein [Vulcanisaeta distributa]
MGGLGFEFWSWWEYTGKITKAITIIGIAAIIILAIIIISPHIKPLQAIDKSLGLVQVQTIYVPVNHTVYVNQTVVRYVNQTIVKYVNQTVPVYVSVPVNPMDDLAICYAKMVVLNNGTAWVVGGVVVIPQKAAQAAAQADGFGGDNATAALCPPGSSVYVVKNFTACVPWIGITTQLPPPTKSSSLLAALEYGNGKYFYDAITHLNPLNGQYIAAFLYVLNVTYYNPQNNTFTLRNGVELRGGNATYALYFYYAPNGKITLTGPCDLAIVGPLTPSQAEEVMLPYPVSQWAAEAGGRQR